MSHQCIGYSVSLNSIDPRFDGQWQGITTASDGACYFAASTHSDQRGAGFFRFDPKNREVSVLAEDMTTECGEDINRTTPQGKIHSPIVEAGGKLFLSTHLGGYWPGAPEAYPGAHVLSYDLSDRTFHDYGVVRDRFTIYSAIGVDPERKKLFAFVVPWADEDVERDGCHLYRIDITNGEKEDLGRVGPSGRIACFWFFVDQAGNCWFSLWRAAGGFPEGGHGNLFRVRPDESGIEMYPGVLPDCRLLYADGQALPDSEATMLDRAWTWVAPLPDRKNSVFLMGMFAGEDERLWRFTPGEAPPTSENFSSIGVVGPTFLATALGGDRVYYVQRGNVRAARGWCAEFERDRDPAGVDWMDIAHREDLHLKSISLNSEDNAEVTDHGLIVDQDGRTARHIDALAADNSGRVFLTGSWHLLPGEAGTRQHQWATTRDYIEVKRSERFAFFQTGSD